MPRSASRGFTLVELMVVVALVGVVGASAVHAASGAVRRQETASLARGILYAAQRGRADATTDGCQRQIRCSPAGCFLYRASAPGMAPVSPTWSATGDGAAAGPQGRVAGMSPTTSVGIGTPAGFAPSITLFPDGSASPGTVFVNDANDVRRYKIYLYPATGMARLVDRW